MYDKPLCPKNKREAINSLPKNFILYPHINLFVPHPFKYLGKQIKN
jgi:hypothetical protein